MFTQPRNSCDVHALLRRTSPFPDGLQCHPDGFNGSGYDHARPSSAVVGLNRRSDGEIE